MRTRIIKTQFWTDSVIAMAPREARYLFIYLLTCPYINLGGIFELPERRMKFETGLNIKELRIAKRWLEERQRVIFKGDWVCVINAEKHNRYKESPDVGKAYLEEKRLIPPELLTYSESTPISTGRSTPPSTNNIKYINKKEEIRNKKEEIRNKIKDLANKKRMNEDIDPSELPDDL